MMLSIPGTDGIFSAVANDIHVIRQRMAAGIPIFIGQRMAAGIPIFIGQLMAAGIPTVIRQGMAAGIHAVIGLRGATDVHAVIGQRVAANIDARPRCQRYVVAATLQLINGDGMGEKRRAHCPRHKAKDTTQ